MKHIDYWDYDIAIYQISDYQAGDTVSVKKREHNHGGLPLYLNDEIMTVEKIGRKNLKLSNTKYPGETWYAGPNEVEPFPKKRMETTR